MDKLSNEFKDSLISNTENALEDYIELGIDSFIDDGILKDIPIVSSIVSGLKIAKNIYDRNLLKQTLVFLNELNNGTVSKDKLIAYKSTIENNPKKCEDELGRILLYLNSFIDKEKSMMLAKLFKAYVKQIISWNEFCEYSEIINRLFIQDISILKNIYLGNITDTSGRQDIFRIERINSLGIIGTAFKSVNLSITNGISDTRQDMYITMNRGGKKFMDIIMK